MALRALCLFDGYGGFELGFRCAGINVRTVARVERDSHAAAILVARMEETHLDKAPIWDDVTTFDGRPWRGRVDIVTAGFNCQPFSAAGQRRGVDDERWLWPDIARIVAEVGPRFVFLENVTGLVRHGLPYIVADLADLGFDAEWGLLSAAAVGAPHRRERFWLLAMAPSDRRRLEAERELGSGSSGWLGRNVDGSGGADVGHTSRARRPEIARSAHGDETPHEPQHTHIVDSSRSDAHPPAGRPRRTTSQPGTHVADPSSVGLRSGLRSGPATKQSPSALSCRYAWPPRPDDHTGWERWIAEGGPEPSLRRRVDGRPLGLAESLHAGGNGLVPAVAAHAFLQLAERLQQ